MTDVEQSCFIAMPISTSSAAADLYGDPDHFVHVLEHLLVPAVESAGYRAIRPAAVGSDLIHAEIIRNIGSADLVLCDATSLNANVFFELGIRTALNKPVSIIRDSLTPVLPFDTGVLNTHTYDSSLAPWLLNDEIEKIANHVQVSADRAAGQNGLWKYFGLEVSAQEVPRDRGDPVLDRLDLLLSEVRGARSHREEPPSPSLADLLPRGTSKGKLVVPRVQSWHSRDFETALPSSSRAGFMPEGLSDEEQTLLKRLADVAGRVKARVWLESITDESVAIDCRPFELALFQVDEMKAVANESGRALFVQFGDSDD
ncbi:hypothetical protein DEJ28_15390 [Curtobacterium sp. MCPF17_002]|uniref:hypothetical protein n=1 Tax=Curtobacterium sp. MCPF17_002 TaxID=2175645 RepID=UPI0011B384BE|nr:hypothetical protein [Curtobacterium sp. MCPF17_002]WIB77020.1 hypothetical protein DEJ28_15390 [Curtobacterium sp. MCPF17_002]